MLNDSPVNSLSGEVTVAVGIGAAHAIRPCNMSKTRHATMNQPIIRLVTACFGYIFGTPKLSQTDAIKWFAQTIPKYKYFNYCVFYSVNFIDND